MPTEVIHLPGGATKYKVQAAPATGDSLIVTKVSSTTLLDGAGGKVLLNAGQPDTLLLDITPGGTVFVFDPMKHIHGFHGWFLKSSPHYKGEPHPLGGSLAGHKPGDVVATKSGKVFQVDKVTDKGVKAKPVDTKTGKLKGGYTVLAHKTPVHTVELAKHPGEQHPLGDLVAGTYISTKKGKKFKVKGHGKWTTLLPVDDAGQVKGKHTVLPKTTIVTIHAPDESHTVTTETVEQLQELAQAGQPQASKGAEAAAVGKAAENWLVHDGLLSHGEAVFVVGKALDYHEGEGGMAWGAAFEHAMMDKWPQMTPEQAQDYLGSSGHGLSFYEAIAQPKLSPKEQEMSWFEQASKAQDASAGILTEWDWSFKQKQEFYGRALEIWKTNSTVAALKNNPPTAWATAFTIAVHEVHPGADDQLKTEIFQAVESAVQEVAGGDKLGEAFNKSMEGLTADQAVKAQQEADKLKEQLPTRFPKAVPKTYEEGVGKDTKIQIQATPSNGTAVVRVSPDGHAHMLEYFPGYMTKTEARKLARTHAAPHEAIEEVYVTQVPTPEPQHFEVGDHVLNRMGTVLQLLPDSEGHQMVRSLSGSGHYSNPRLLYGHPALMPLPKDPSEFPAGIFDPQKSKRMYWEWASQHGALDFSVEKQIRGAAPNKYSPYLQGTWDPDQLVGQKPQPLIAAMKVRGYLEIKPREKGRIKLINRAGQRILVGLDDAGNVESIERLELEPIQIDGTAEDFRQRLQEVMDTKGDLAGMNPRVSDVPEASTSFVRQLLYDMAVGKKKGVAQAAGAKVKTDEQYAAELEQEGAVPGSEHFLPQAQQSAPPIRIKSTASKQLLTEGGAGADPHFKISNPSGLPDPASAVYELHHPEQLDMQQRAVLWSIFKRRGMAQLALDRNKADLVQAAKDIVTDWNTGKLDVPAPEGSPFATMAEYVKDNADYISAGAQHTYDVHQEAIQGSANQLRKAEAQKLIDERRDKEGTVKAPTEDFQLPTWDQAEFKPQLMAEIQQMAQDDPNQRDVPAFYTGGVFRDGVLQHRVNQTDGKVPLQFDQTTIARLSTAGAIEGPNSDSAVGKLTGSYPIYPGRSYTLQDGVNKKIEYIYHSQGANGAPTNHRGWLRMTGYTPQEAANRLHELGLLGDLEPQVPFDTVMRGPRRHGTVDPILGEYVRGEAPPPQAKQLLVHGLTGSAGATSLLNIIASGGLKSIFERWRLGVHQWGASPSGDMRSGIDHAVFTNYGNSAVGQGSAVRILMRPSAFLRRDIVLSGSDYGASNTRYSKYRSFLNGLQSGVGEPQTNLYAEVSPAVRQYYLTGESAGLMSDAEFNVGPQLPVEDWETIGIQDASLRQQVDQLLDQKLASGEIKSRPQVVSIAELPAHQRSVG